MGKKILLVDADKQFRKLMTNVLEGRGHEVFDAESGQEGKDELKESQPDLLVVCGPLSDDADLDWIITTRRQCPELRIVYVAASQREAAPIKDRLCKELGVKLVTHKPLIPFVFGAQLEGQLAGPDGQYDKLKDFETMFLALVTKYAHVLPGKLGSLGTAIENAKSDPENIDLLAEVRGQAHKIKGTGGSLGFRQVGELMAFIEEAAVSMPDKSANEQKELWVQVQEKIAQAREVGEREAEEVSRVVANKDEAASPIDDTPTVARIMVVDADGDFLDAIEKIGAERHLEIVKALSLRQALDKAALFPLDAALVSVEAETAEESFSLARALRELPGYETLPLAFLSNEQIIKDHVEAAHAGASLYLDKPLQSDSLEQAVQHLVAIRQGGRPRIVICDDDEFFANSVAIVLRAEGMIVRMLHDPSKILDTMQDFPPDLLLLDVMMPGISGFEVCRMLRTVPRWHDLPIIFLTGQTGVDARLEAFRCGGDDYLPKPVVNEELLMRVRVRLDRARLMKERSDKDTITGLLLRRAFSEQLAAMIAEAQRLGTRATICLIDVDHFKKVNDTYGHLAGDRVLAGLGQLLARRFRVDDLRGRWGGEEFILAFRRESKETMQKAIHRVLDEFTKIEFRADDGQTFFVSFSGGLASFPEDGASVYDLLQTADKRLYEAKKAGRRRIILDDAVAAPSPASTPANA
jgi:diguanylate cyclase (GGDEF)-like protein